MIKPRYHDRSVLTQWITDHYMDHLREYVMSHLTLKEIERLLRDLGYKGSYGAIRNRARDIRRGQLLENPLFFRVKMRVDYSGNGRKRMRKTSQMFQICCANIRIFQSPSASSKDSEKPDACEIARSCSD